MFDHTKLRTDEVITSAERSRDRLNKLVGLVSAVATLGFLIAGAFGYKQFLDVNQTVDKMTKMAEDMKKTKDQAEEDARASKIAVDDSRKAVEQIKKDADDALNQVKDPFIRIVRERFSDNVKKGSMADAKGDYETLISLGGKDELEAVIPRLAQSLLGDKPPSDEFTTLALLDELVTNSEHLAGDSKQAADESTRVKIYCLRIGYSILIDQDRPAREPFYVKLTDYLKAHPTAKLQTSMISDEVLRQHPDKAAELKVLRDLTTRP